MRIIKTLLIISLLFFAASAQSFTPQWVIQNAFEKEILPINEINSVTPEELKNAMEKYHQGEFRDAAEMLQKLRSLNLPDNRLDFIIVALAECYRQLDLSSKALELYHTVLNKFKNSDKTGAALYRILEYAVDNDDVRTIDSVCSVFQTTLRKHDLYNSVLYLTAKSCYNQKRYGESIQLLSQIGKNTSTYLRACFLTALSEIHLKNEKKALSLFEEVRNNSSDIDLCAEATILTGDIYYNKNKIPNAISFYSAVPPSASRYQFALLKIAHALLDLKHFEEAEKTALKFLDSYPQSNYYFEIASILEQVYTKSGKEKEALALRTQINSQVIDNRQLFEIYEEIDRTADVVKGWQIIEYSAIRRQNKELLLLAQEKIQKGKNLKLRLQQLLRETGIKQSENPASVFDAVPYLAERRYLKALKKRNLVLEDSISRLIQIIRNTDDGSDTLIVVKIDSMTSMLDSMKKEYAVNESEYALVVKECLAGDNENNRKNGELQARLTDWSFANYQNKKQTLKMLSEKISSGKKRIKDIDKKQPVSDSTVFNIKSAEAERAKLVSNIADDRERLTDHIVTMLEVYPKSLYNAQIYYRLSELYFDAAGDEFQKKLHDYEKKMTSGTDTTGLQFPEYCLDNVIDTYQKIIDQYPTDPVADDACFYKALALQKMGLDSLSNEALLYLTAKYPESEYYVESNMNIGRYYFDHPRVQNDIGYKLAEDAFRKVLYYKDHPQYIQALYHLGWCYYMQDHYDDAIAVFKYLVEEGKLDFDPAKSDVKQVANPLLRGEAIDYIAISFDEDGHIDDAYKFLQLIGNQDYSALIFKRIAELREEDLDYSTACSVYRRLLVEFPLSSVAPAAMIRLIWIYESQNLPDSAAIIRKDFFNSYSFGSDWQKRNILIDSVAVRRIDSMAVSIGLYLADDSYRKAEYTADVNDYQIAAKNYQQLIDKYGNGSKAENASWNLAVILETKMGKKSQAFTQYQNFYRNTGFESSRREQAALNAFAIAQSLLSTDSTDNEKFKMSLKKVKETVDNYCSLFPSGNSYSQVLLGMGAVYFNRKMFAEAMEYYEKINKIGAGDKNYYESLFLTGQCLFGLEKYVSATEIFEKIWNNCDDQVRRTEAIKLLLQSAFLNAKSLFNAGEYKNAAIAFKSIEEKYPGSTYGDMVLYNAAESFEKIKMWAEACDNYYSLVNKYPGSKLASVALFNAALDFEKADKFQRAAETYELLISGYPESEKAKDALFNLGFCYEKLGKMDKMAEANERYSLKYPGEKDVEALLLRSADFYSKSSLHEKAITVYRNFVFRYPRSVRSVEALFMIGKSYLDQGDRINALLSFEQVEPHNSSLNREGFEGNNYFAAEAAFHIASLRRDDFLFVKLIPPEDQIKAAIKTKSDFIVEAVKAYQRVIQYQSEKMFEAAYRIGELYQDFSEEYKNQQRPKLDPIKSVLLEKDISILSSQLLKNAIQPYRKAIELAAKFDSLNLEQNAWVNRSRNGLLYCYTKAGENLFNAVDVMKNAPVPDEIREKPLHLYQYLKQLYETLAPMKENVVKYYSEVISQTDSTRISDSTLQKFKDEYARSNFLIGYDYDQLSVEILKNTQSLPKNISEDEREELLFQLEDIVFELQDKAILSYEDAVSRLQDKNLTNTVWYTRIWESLARLSPDKYGKSFFKTLSISTGKDWLVRPDSVEKWNTKDIPFDGWYESVPVKLAQVTLSGQKCRAVWGNDHWTNIYIWKHLYIDGVSNNASVYVKSPGKYKLYINGVLTINDTAEIKKIISVDSATGIDALMQGGDNVLCLEVQRNSDLKSGVAVLFTAYVDTTKKFKSTVKLPSVSKDTDENENSTNNIIQPNVKTTDNKVYKNRKQLQKAIQEFNVREQVANDEIKKERLEIQKIILQLQSIEEKLKKNVIKK